MNAEWIAPPGLDVGPDAYFLARRQWTIERLPSLFKLHIAAESRYVLWINGSEVGVGPARGTATVTYFDSYEIQGLLTVGENWISLSVYSPNTHTFKASPIQAGLLVWSTVVGLDSLDRRQTGLVTDETWQTCVAPHWSRAKGEYTFQIGWMEWQDLRAEPLGWQVGEDTGQAGWAAAAPLGSALSSKRLVERDIPFLRSRKIAASDVNVAATVPPKWDERGKHPQFQHDVARRVASEPHIPLFDQTGELTAGYRDGPWDGPMKVEATSDRAGVVILASFPEEMNGSFELDIDAPSGTVVDVAYDELLLDGRVAGTAGERYSFVDRYILREGRQRVGNILLERGFRVVQIVLREFESPVTIWAVSAIDRTYPFERRSSFACSDPQLDRLWDACLKTLEACATDTFVDCPWRENALYLNDLLVESVVALQGFGDGRLTAHCLRMAASQVTERGLVPSAIPFGAIPGRTYDESELFLSFPAANLYLPVLLEEYLLYTGDYSLVEEQFGLLDSMLDYMDRSANENGLFHPEAGVWNFVDWSFELSGSSLDGKTAASVNWLWVISLETTARLHEAVEASVLTVTKGDPIRRAAELREKSAAVAAATHSRFWNADLAAYVEWQSDEATAPVAKLTQALALLSGRTPPYVRESLRVAMCASNALSPELFMHHFLLRALNETEGQESLNLIRRHWFPILEAGAETIWECGVIERGRDAFDNQGSLCHGFSTSPIDTIQSAILGIKPIAPGFARCSFSPNTGDLEFAEGVVITPRGPIGVRWERDQSRLFAWLELPPDVIVDLPTGETLFAGAHHLEIELDSLASRLGTVDIQVGSRGSLS